MMKKIIPIYFVLLFSCFYSPAVAQQFRMDTIGLINYIRNATITDILDQKPPEFVGGKEAWSNFIKSNVKAHIPIMNRAPAGKYFVRIRFTVDRDGGLFNLAAETNCGYGMEEELIRCMKKSPKWIPAEMKPAYKVTFVQRQEFRFEILKNNCVVEIL